MSDARLTEKDALSTLATGDKTHIVDVSDTTGHAGGTSKYFLISTLSSYLGALTQTLTNKTHDTPVIQNWDGWVDANESWTYSAWADTNGESTATFTVPSDARLKYQPGMRGKFTQPTDGAKFGVITAVAETTIKMFLNTDYDFDNEAITLPYYSPMRVPFGFVLDPDKYMTELSSTTARTTANPTQNAWSNAESFTIPVGIFNIKYSCGGHIRESSGTEVLLETTLSTANNTESDSDFTIGRYLRAASGDILTIEPHGREKTLTLTASDVYYLNYRTTLANIEETQVRGDIITTIISAKLAYL